MIGMPVVIDGKNAGRVVRGVLTEDGRALRGVVIRGGLKMPRWIRRDQISLVGQLSLLADGKPSRVPRDAEYRLFRVSDAEGARLGVVTDALLHEETLRVAALEISFGPVDDLTDGRWYATVFHVQPRGATGHVTVTTQPKEVMEE
ncbi:MAG: hypothetical protein IKQ41_12970 [Clostridia bacterium]|nr:hypothetical protein [Clostridia bacterium]